MAFRSYEFLSGWNVLGTCFAVAIAVLAVVIAPDTCGTMAGAPLKASLLRDAVAVTLCKYSGTPAARNEREGRGTLSGAG
jgi:hypothetical protein